MQIRAVGFTLALSLLAGAVRADDVPSDARLGKKIANVTLADAAGKPVLLHDLKDRKAVVIVFLSFECPMSTGYAAAARRSGQGVRRARRGDLGRGRADDVTPAQLAKHAKEFDIPFPLLLDAKHAAADALKADVTPEAFVLDGNFVLRYRGRIDDQYSARLKRNARLTREDVRAGAR